MGIEYVNRCGKKYFLLQGKTKTGKPKYYVSLKPDGVAVEQMPEGYELYENPERGLVSVRKIRPTKLLPEEREKLEVWTRKFAGIEYYCVEIQEDSLVVYTPATNPAAAASLLSKLFPSFAGQEASNMEWTAKHTAYQPMLRFTLASEEKRLFAVERWCFRGSIDGWFFLASPQALETQARKYLPHLNKESFYDLF